MSREYAAHILDEGNGETVEKRKYDCPQLIRYGAVRDLTQSGSGPFNESSSGCNGGPTRKPNGCTPSERRAKENIVRIGTHPLGIGLYLFDYRPEHREQWGHGRQFGVMADEVEAVLPAAVSTHEDGYKRVDHGLLGISRSLH